MSVNTGNKRVFDEISKDGLLDSMTEGFFVLSEDQIQNEDREGTEYEMLEGEEAFHRDMREELFKERWNIVENILKEEMEKSIQGTLDKIVEFVNGKEKRIEEEDTQKEIAEIKTVVVSTGINGNDYNLEFKRIADTVRTSDDEVANKVAIVTSKKVKNIKTLMAQIIRQILGSKEQEKKYGHNYDIETLGNYCNAELEAQGKRPRLVVIFEDFEGFPPVVVSDFIEIISIYREEIPVILVFGVASGMSALQQRLRFESLQKINVEKFSISSTTQETINRIVYRVFVENGGGVNVGFSVYKFMMKQFMHSHLSINQIFSQLKYAYMDMFYGNPLSILMASLSSPTMAYQIKTVDELKFTPSHIEMVLMQKSVIRYVGNKYSDDKELLKKALNDQVHFTRVILVDMLTIVELYQRRYKVGIKLIEAIQSVLPKNAKNQAFSARIIHYNTVGEGFESSQVFAQLVSGLKRLSSSQILELLHKILSILEREEELYRHHKLKLAGIRKPDGLCYDPKQLCGQPIAKITECISAFKSNTSSPAETKSASVYTRRQITENPYLLALSSNDVQNENALRLANLSIPNILSSFLLHYSNVPLHEIFYYDNSNLLSQSFNPQIRHYIQTALSTPEFYLGSLEDSQAKFDISVLYNLHLETGRFINLYDWFMSYNYVISRGGPIDSGLLVRFQTAVNSLFFMGLIKPTNVKPDHIERLTFGSF